MDFRHERPRREVHVERGSISLITQADMFRADSEGER